MDIHSDKDVIIAPITSTFGGSVSMIRISGEKAVEICAPFFSPAEIRYSEGGRFYHGQITDEEKKPVDDVVLFVYRAPKSFTGEDVVEISCHANPIIIQDLLQLFQRNGCRMAQPGEFSKRAFLNGKMDLTQAEAIADLISAKSRFSIWNSLSMIEGSLSKKLKQIRSDLIDLAGLMELDLDFGEEDLEVISSDDVLKRVGDIIQKISQLINSYDLGKVLKRGIEVLITGRPNVGKSSLMNAFLGRDRVIVSQIPGTTRDVIHEDVMVEDVLIRFIDTAGIRMTEDVVESAGVEKAMTLFEEAAVILLVLDLSAEPSIEDKNLIKTLSSVYHRKVIVVGNKADLPRETSTEQLMNVLKYESIPVSAKTGQNIEQLKHLIRKKIYQGIQDAPEDIIITNERQYKELVKAKDSLKRVYEAAGTNPGNEFLAVDIREAVNHIGEISGEITTDDILNNIFSRFCIGK
ncbi:MAG TPA: tRNA uridine-5-carboxymethylaminomethyl(34) synthesis GTPase MnmE [Caldithrix abyssi]|uniref:tRNA modification GTPase MnmE n=1 Tax=Caldithrix abyssi TaxID=187145 RepID=A0A7V4UBZ7_CALAY|nr:tRNA uridine-5-carboxymethylaminomethyl(34) synthesis GTPase MnmE [Caldithrix abyssi]